MAAWRVLRGSPALMVGAISVGQGGITCEARIMLDGDDEWQTVILRAEPTQETIDNTLNRDVLIEYVHLQIDL